MLCVVGREETLARLGVGDIVAGFNDVSGSTAEYRQNGSRRTGLDRGGQRRRSVLRRGIGLLGAGYGDRQRQHHHGGDGRPRGSIKSEWPKYDHGDTSAGVGIPAPPASQSL